MATLGRLIRPLEDSFGHVWSLGEMLLALSRFDEVRRDPYREALVADIAARGFYVPFDPRNVQLRVDAAGRITAANPYRRVSEPDGAPERIVAQLVRARGRAARQLLVVYHCYGVPVPAVMERLFGLRGLAVDVAYNIMSHHQDGTFPLWPGSGFTRARISHFIENLRGAVTGARALAAALRHAHGYESVYVLGFSIGGQLALHVANSEAVDRLVLYCPVTSLHATSSELGLMRLLVPALRRSLGHLPGARAFDDLALTDPLHYTLRTPEERVHVIVQEHDVLAPVRHVEALRVRYPRVHWHAFQGTHLWPAGMRSFQRVIRDALAG